MSSPAPSPDPNQAHPPPDQPPVPESPPPSPTGFSLRVPPKVVAFAIIMTVITALYFKRCCFALDTPGFAVVIAVWLIAGLGLQRMVVYWKSSRKARH